jgi:hypothetical protein
LEPAGLHPHCLRIERAHPIRERDRRGESAQRVVSMAHWLRRERTRRETDASPGQSGGRPRYPSEHLRRLLAEEHPDADARLELLRQMCLCRARPCLANACSRRIS